jgi:hypothetical protein
MAARALSSTRRLTSNTVAKEASFPYVALYLDRRLWPFTRLLHLGSSQKTENKAG